MRIAFYAPLKPPTHPVPSGDRLMARLLIEAMRQAGHTVDLASDLRSRAAKPGGHQAIQRLASGEIDRLAAEWRRSGPPDLFFCYHLYYKAPDFIGPVLCSTFGIPYVAAEASLSPKRASGPWADAEASVRQSLGQAALVICFTRRDRDGLLRILPGLSTQLLSPFIDAQRFTVSARGSSSPRLFTVAMMRSGDKLESYRILAEALERCADLPWRLTIVGDGEARRDVEAMFASIAERVEWLGERSDGEIPEILAQGDLYVWPGVGEAYGMAYLEAQAVGLPVVAQAIAGVPEVVHDGETGMLTPPGDVQSYADAIRRLLLDTGLRQQMGAAARAFVHEERSLPMAAACLKTLLARFEP